MKLMWLVLIAALLVSIITLPFVYTQYEISNAFSSDNFLFGVSFGINSVQDAKLLIDKVKGYTNMFAIDSWDISMNETELTQVCDYAAQANLKFMVYFEFIFNSNANNSRYWDNASLTSGFNAWHIPWLSNAKVKYGDKFLGIYLSDEPGGNQIDTGYWGGTNHTYSGRAVTTFTNVTDYNDAANRYNSSLSHSSMQVAKNLSLPVFTSDYALQWFDYLAGYDAVFTELGDTRGTDSKLQQIALCRGAANVQNKQWGAIITWTYNNPPYYENGVDMLGDMTNAYYAGANYLIVFNYPQGALTEEHFSAMQEFWNQIHSHPRNSVGTTEGQVAFVLPKNYGWGMRTPDDNIWGLWPADNESAIIWDKMTTLLNSYGLRLDIVYDDPQYNIQQKYSQIYYWNGTTG